MYWEEPCTFEPDIILAADVLYDPGGLHAMLCKVACIWFELLW